ncbi:MAG TPA: HAMP domain-containing sensor histidine kinase [Prolixibacteraceae bacterium]|nr:HAMP domain-containing sensor histidine kinase [Prolixibacteraceae bacterium]
MKKIVIQLTVILLLVVALPISYFYINQAANLTKNEAIVQQAFDQQLETILFTINQNSENYVVAWLNRLDLPVDCNSTIMKNIIAQLFQNNRAIEEIAFFDSENNTLILSELNGGEVLLEKLDNQTINDLKRKYEQGYRRVEALRNDDHTFFYFMIKSINKPVIGAIAVHSKTFIEQNLSPGIQQIAQSRFSISVVDTVKGTTMLSNNLEPENPITVHRQLLWYLPGNVVSISLLSATITELVSERSKRDSYIFLIMVLVVLIGVAFVIVTIRREMILSEMKSEFVSNVSHEIRTPLALISMYSETLLLKRIKTEEKTNEYLHVIFHETNRLAALVNRILSFSKMEKNKREYLFAKVNVNEVINEVVENFEPHLKANNVALSLQLTDKNTNIQADRESIVELLINLIDNAVKYGNNSDKKIEIRTVLSNNNLCLEVEDNGIGISRKHQKVVFDKFYRVTDGNLAHLAKGSGLGLNIVKKIMEQHRGNILLSSNEGLGSCFSLNFPVNNKKNG